MHVDMPRIVQIVSALAKASALATASVPRIAHLDGSLHDLCGALLSPLPEMRPQKREHMEDIVTGLN